MWRWTRISSTKWEDAWAERLRGIEPGRLAFLSRPGSRFLRIDAYLQHRREAERLREAFGGTVAAQNRATILPPPKPQAPISIRGRLRILSEEPAGTGGEDGIIPTLWIPAEMAFGTGGHATTAGCLRMLCDVSDHLGEKWSLLDAGTGSGILALAACRFGAGEVEAFDFDPASVRAAKANARRNGCRPKIFRADVTAWRPGRTYDVVTANLFCNLLVASAPWFRKTVRPGGWLILSGILASQAAEVVSAMGREGFALERTTRRGKWVAATLRRRAGREKAS